MKRLLLAHDPIPSQDPPHIIPDLEAFLQKIRCTPQQKQLVRRVFIFGDALQDEVNIGQGPPGTKARVIQKGLFYIRCSSSLFVSN